MSKNPALNGTGARKCASWIESFVEYTSDIESPEIFRRWAAISAISATLEQKVWLKTGQDSILYPNLYVFLVGPPGIGKTRAISKALGFYRDLPEPKLGATSMSRASLVDYMVEAKRTIINVPDPAIEYNTLYIAADELSAFMHEYNSELLGALTTFYDVVPYAEGKRVNNIRIRMLRPQLNIVSGTTPVNLSKTMPEHAWGQGFSSRVIMVYADTKPSINDFDAVVTDKPKEMAYDMAIINALHGQFSWTDDYKRACLNWKELGFLPLPKHPKLQHYATRREAHLRKLSMVACVDRGNRLNLDKQDFNKAMGWLLEAEVYMEDIFKSAASHPDSDAMEDIAHFVRAAGDKGVKEHHLVHYAQKRVPAHSVLRVIEILEKGGQIKIASIDKLGMRTFNASNDLQ